MTISITRTKTAYWVIFALLFLAVAALRLLYCTQIPVNTGDLLRNIYYGLYVNQQDISAGGKTLSELNPALSWVAWANLKYNYPINTLLLFTVIAKISPTLFFAKLLLTVIEALNTWLIFKYSRQRLLAFVYWASPISIWWVSHEGQFEPLQSFFVIAALCLLVKHRSWAFMLLAMAIQVKLTAVLLLPFFLFSIRGREAKQIATAIMFFAMGFLPTIIASLYYPIVDQVMATTISIQYNPYYWNVFNWSMFRWNPTWLIIIHQIVTYGFFIFLIWIIIKRKEIVRYFAPVGFIALCKASSLAQFWYFIIFTPFLLPIQNKTQRLWLFALAPLFDITSIIQMVSGPYGYKLGEYYKACTPFLPLTI